MNQREHLSRSQEKAIVGGKLVETTNALGPQNFVARFYDQEAQRNAETAIAELLGRHMHLVLQFPEALKDRDMNTFESCFNLIQDSSADDYKKSEIKWSPTAKRKEMLLPDMRYLILCEDTTVIGRSASFNTIFDTPKSAVGFVSFMITYEDGFEVVYIYEIHLAPGLRGQGVGSVLMRIVESIGQQAGVEKSMLTVFKANDKAVKWYERNGYSLDDFSPGPRVLRSGKIKEPSYLILSKKGLKSATELDKPSQYPENS